MFVSTQQQLGEFDIIRQSDHIVKVWSAIEQALPSYWDGFVREAREANPASVLSGKFKTSDKGIAGGALANAFDRALVAYDRQAEKYRNFFDPEALEEFEDDVNAFKQGLAKDVPVIANTLHQRSPELKDWQVAFRSTRSKDLLNVFANLLDYHEEWTQSHPRDLYHELNDLEGFGLDAFEGEKYRIDKVIGTGIKSIVLYHLDSERMPRRGRSDIYALYFLSGRDSFGLPSKSSEFLMVDEKGLTPDGSMVMEYNYWYPYALFSLYGLRIYRWMERQAIHAGLKLDRSMRYIYLERFFESVCAQHAVDLKTMRAWERFEIPA